MANLHFPCFVVTLCPATSYLGLIEHVFRIPTIIKLSIERRLAGIYNLFLSKKIKNSFFVRILFSTVFKRFFFICEGQFMSNLRRFFTVLPVLLFALNLGGHSQVKLGAQLDKNKFFTQLYQVLKEHLIYPITSILSQVPQSIYVSFFPPHPYSATPAFVRFDEGDRVGQEEHDFLDKRTKKVKGALESLLEMPLSEDEVPRIAFCFSGGGYRAMIATIGFLKGAQRAGLLDTACYMAGLSGSTWAIAPWIASGASLTYYRFILQYKVSQGLIPVTDSEGIGHIIKTCVQRVRYKQLLSSIDIYGLLLANVLLNDFKHNRFSLTLTESHSTVKEAAIPLPIYATITTNTDPYEWFECTPFEIGSSYTHCYVPTWSYGRRFKRGKSINYAPEQSLGYMMGIFGSAFDVDLEDIVRIRNKTIEETLAQLPAYLQSGFGHVLHSLATGPLDEVRLLPSMLRNPTYQMSNIPLSKSKLLSLVDAGIDFNLPFPPLLRKDRKVDIIIVYDTSAPEKGSDVLRAAKNYAIAKHLKFPEIVGTDIDTGRVTVFKDERDPECPVIIYFPMSTDVTYSRTFDPVYECLHGYCSTFNFTYTADQYTQLIGLAEHVIYQEAELVKNNIRQVINKKRLMHN